MFEPEPRDGLVALKDGSNLLSRRVSDITHRGEKEGVLAAKPFLFVVHLQVHTAAAHVS